MNKRFTLLAMLVFCAVSAIPASYYIYAGTYGLNVALKRGGTIWKDIPEDHKNVSKAMQLALSDKVPSIKAGPFKWREISNGLELTELPIMTGEQEVDRFMLTRLDPTHFDLEVKTDPSGSKELADWMQGERVVAAINGSYYDRYGKPDTPIVSGGVAMGPTNYNATHGAITVVDGQVKIVDLEEKSWQEALASAHDAMVSYPLLVSPDKNHKVTSNQKWLANRTFIAIDKNNNVLLGSTKDAFFSLERLAIFLKDAPLDIVAALNLDGGPVSCHGVKAGRIVRNFCGVWETATHEKEVKLLAPAFGNNRWSLPIALVIRRKSR